MITREKITEIAGIVRAAYEEPNVDRALNLFEAIARQVPDQVTVSGKTEIVIEETALENKPVASPKAEVSRPQGNGHSGEAENKAPERGLSQSCGRPDGEKPRPDNQGHREGVRDSKIQSLQPDPKRGGISKGHEGRAALVDLTRKQSEHLETWIAVDKQPGIDLSAGNVSDALGEKYPNVVAHANSLREKGYLEKTGSGPATVWKVLYNPDKTPYTKGPKITKCPPARTAPDINSRIGW